MHLRYLMPRERSLVGIIALAFILSGCVSIEQLRGHRAPAAQVLDAVPDGTSLNVRYVVSAATAAAGSGNSSDSSDGFLAKFRASFSKRKAGAVSAVESDAEVSDMLATVDKTLALVGLDKLFGYELNGAFRKGKPFEVKNIVASNEPIGDPEELLQQISEDTLLVLDTKYFFTADYRAVRVETSAKLYRADDSARKLKPMYVNDVIAQTDVVAAQGSEALQLWTANQGAKLTSSLRDALRETARLLASDINQAQQWEALSKAREWPAMSPIRTGTTMIRGVLVKEHDNRFVIRESNGTLLSLPRDDT